MRLKPVVEALLHARSVALSKTKISYLQTVCCYQLKQITETWYASRQLAVQIGY
jgi:hypothetical protein